MWHGTSPTNGGLVQFDVFGWSPGPRTGAPLLSGSLGWLECELVESYKGGDHSVFIGGVLASSRGEGQSGLVFFGGAFHQVNARYH